MPRRTPGASERATPDRLLVWLGLLSCLLLLAGLAPGCGYACGPLRPVPPQRLCLVASSPSNFHVRVVDRRPKELPVPADGRVAFDVDFRGLHCTQVLLGIPIHRPTPLERRRVIQIVEGARVLRRLSAADIGKLPTDDQGYHLLKVGK